jgi:hypothetical protein
MNTLKTIIALGAVMLLSGTAWSGSIPEFDAVGCDADNFFASAVQYQVVICNNVDDVDYGGGVHYGVPINDYSYLSGEYFSSSASLSTDPCFGFDSAKAPAGIPNDFMWNIVLQMQPESDINLTIYDCVLQENELAIFGEAGQTGLWNWLGDLTFSKYKNPKISVSSGGVYMDGREMPGLWPEDLCRSRYTSKAHWDETIVIALPKTGHCNNRGETQEQLRAGDTITVSVDVPDDSNVDIRYGEDSVILKYIGVAQTCIGTSSPCTESACPTD